MDRGAEFREELARRFPPASFAIEPAVRKPYETDWRGLFAHKAEAILFPGSVDEVAAMVKLCARRQIAIVPQGGNTGLVAGAVPIPDRPQAVLNLKRLQAIRNVDPVNNTMEVEAGVILQTVQEAAHAIDRLFPLSLAAEGSCQIGGTIATNAGGIQVLAYGSMRNLVLGLEVVLPDGSIWNGLRALRKDNSGLDLKQLFIGSEGILGVITAATLRILPRPKSALTLLAAVPSADAALSLFSSVQNLCGSELTSCEYFTDVGLGLVLSHAPNQPSPFQEKYSGFVLFEVSSLDPERDLLARVEPLIMSEYEAGRVLDTLVAQSETQRAALWYLRENLPEGERAAGGAIKHDVAVPITAIPKTIAKIENGLQDVFPGVRLNIFGHLGDGNLHINVMPPPGRPLAEFLAAGRPITAFVEDAVIAEGGTFSAEHGVGQIRAHSLTKHRNPLELHMMRAVKGALDPQWIMNPGKVLELDNP